MYKKLVILIVYFKIDTEMLLYFLSPLFPKNDWWFDSLIRIEFQGIISVLINMSFG